MRSSKDLVLRLLLVAVLPLLPSCDAVEGSNDENLPPETEIVAPEEPSGTLTVADGTPIVLRWRAVDPEEQAGEPGGIAAFQIRLEGGGSVIIDCPPDSGEWWFSSSEDSGSTHFIASINEPTGGTRPHAFRVRAQDVEGCWEPENEAATYVFRYNHPPSSEILAPQADEVVASSFAVRWHGDDVDGEVAEYQYVLDPSEGLWSVTGDTSVSYSDVASGEHEFRLRARDGSGCWEPEYRRVTFQVE